MELQWKLRDDTVSTILRFVESAQRVFKTMKKMNQKETKVNKCSPSIVENPLFANLLENLPVIEDENTDLFPM